MAVWEQEKVVVVGMVVGRVYVFEGLWDVVVVVVAEAFLLSSLFLISVFTGKCVLRSLVMGSRTSRRIVAHSEGGIHHILMHWKRV